MAEYIHVGKSVTKIDSLGLAAGMEKFTDDFPTEDTLHCAILYSPHAHADIMDLDTKAALEMEGVVDVLHFKNVSRVLHTTAGQGYPEPSPYDTVLFDRKVRFIGDRIALVAAESREIAVEALKKISVEYKVLEPLFDIEKAMNPSAPRIHGDEEHVEIPVAYRPEVNLAAEVEIAFGDLEEGFSEADFTEEHTYTMQAASHCAIEPHAALAFFDARGRLVIITTTQVPFHVRRIVSRVLDIPLHSIRVIKPRIGGGFGGKQEVILEPLVALVAWRNKRASRIVLSRREVFVSSRTRHAMRIRLKTGAREDGSITALEMDALMNAGAYGTHALTVLSNTGSKVLPLFNKIDHLTFTGKSVYTNLPIGGAYRGYGATQGYFAFNQQIDMIARRAGQDLLEYCKRWHIQEGETSDVFRALGEGKKGVSQTIKSCRLSECIDRGAAAIDWYEKRGKQLKSGNDRVKGMGLAIAMQGSGIPQVDMASASMKMNDDGSFNLLIGATDIGTGSDTILAQIAAEVLCIPMEKIIVLSSDTDTTPFDTGAYASSTTYISGSAVEKCARNIKARIITAASQILGLEEEDLSLDMEKVTAPKSGQQVTYEQIALSTLYSRDQLQIQAQASYVSQESPPPFIAQFAEVDVDEKTGRIYVVKFISAVDCGQPINPVLVEGQVEGAVVNGISYALWEDYIYNSSGKMLNPRFWDYKIYTALDLPEMKTIVVGSFEETHPFGAKSVAEIAINGPAPAIANAVYDAVGVRMFDTPFTPEKVWRKMRS